VREDCYRSLKRRKIHKQETKQRPTPPCFRQHTAHVQRDSRSGRVIGTPELSGTEVDVRV